MGPYRGSLDFSRASIDVIPLTRTEPDHTWTATDRCGHFHAFSENGDLPTLIAGKRKYRCRMCQERIAPAFITSSSVNREYIGGPTSWTVTALDTPILTYLDVSVRIVSFGITRFGTGTVTDVQWFAPVGAPPTSRISIEGASELGTMKS